jgi:hypothetical protein
MSGTNWVSISQLATFFIVSAVKNLKSYKLCDYQLPQKDSALWSKFQSRVAFCYDKYEYTFDFI